MIAYQKWLVVISMTSRVILLDLLSMQHVVVLLIIEL